MSEMSQEKLLQIAAAAEKLVRCKGRYHSEQNYRALAAFFGVTTPDLPPLEGEALRERAEPVGEVVDQPDGLVMDGTVHLGGSGTHRAIQGLNKMKRMPLGTKFYTSPPAPVADDDSEIKWRELALQFDGHRMQAICFLKQILKELPEAEFSSARDFLKSGPLSGEEVLRNRIAALAQPATVVPELKPVGYLFVSDRGEVVYSPTNWHVTGLRLIGQIYGDISTRRAATLAAPGKEG